MSFITDYFSKMAQEPSMAGPYAGLQQDMFGAPKVPYMGATPGLPMGGIPGQQSAGAPGPAAPAPQMAAGAPSPFMQMHPGLGTLAGGPALPQPTPQAAPAPAAAPAPPQAAPLPAAGFFGGSPSSNPALQDQNPGYSGPGSAPFQDGSQLAGAPYTPPGAALIQKMISALGGVTNGGPLSVLGNMNPGKFGGY